MTGPGLTMQAEQKPPQADIDQRVVFYLRPMQYAQLLEEAQHHAVARRRNGATGHDARINVSQVIRDALVAAGVIDP